MNVALPAIVILLGVLPGIACFYGYFAGRFDKRAAGVSPVEELAFYIALAIPIDATAVWLNQWLFGIRLDFDMATHFLAGTVPDPAATAFGAALRRTYALTATIYFVVLVSAFLLGSFCRRFVWAFRLDTRFSLLTLRHDWFYALHGRRDDLSRDVLAYVDVLTEHPEGSRLYRGIVVDFEMAPTGGLASVTIIDVERGSGRGRYFKWKPVPSDQLTIIGSKIHSVNMRYVEVESQPLRGWPRMKRGMRVLLRSFFLQEP